MAMTVQNNIRALNANRNLGITQGIVSKSTEKLSSGYKINRAADDAAGLSISEKMRKQIRGLTQASANAEDGISAVQTAEGALTEVHDMLQRMNELAVKAANETNSSSDRQYIQDEVDQLVTEIDRVSTTTKFNEIYLLKGKNKTSNKPGGLSYATANANLKAMNLQTASEEVDLKKGTLTLSMTATTTGGVDVTAGGITNTKYEGSSIELGGSSGTKYILVTGTKLGGTTTTMPASVNEVAKALTGTKESGKTVKAFASMDDLVAAVKKDFNGQGDIKNIDVKQNGSGNPQLIVNTFADLNNGNDISLHVGADSSQDNKIKMNINMLSARGLGINGIRVDGDYDTNANKAIDTIAAAIQKVSTQRSSLGAVQNRLEHTIKNLDNIVENTTAAESQIRDTDMASQMVKHSNANILAQAGQSMLAQSNQANQGVLSLIG